MTSPDLQKLEQRIAVLERAAEQSVAMGQALLGAIQREGARMAILESHRVVQALSRASQFHPKTRTVVFVGRGTFADNVKYAYLNFCDAARAQNVRCIFLPHDMAQYEQVKNAGLPCISPQHDDWSYEDAKILLGAAVAVIGDNFHPHSGRSPISYALLQGAKIIQLWHGIPLKEIGLNHMFAPGMNNVFLSELMASSGCFDVLIGHAAAAESEWRRWFGFRDYAAAGYPRNDVFFREPTAQDLINVDRESLQLVQEAKRANKPVIIYGPTFRDHLGAVGWFEKSGIPAFADYCRAKEYLLLINLHPYEQNATGDLLARHPHLKFVAPHTDAYPIVRHASVFVTDYSSLAFDVLHVDCSLVFYRPDHEDYMANARALIPGREGYTPGDVVAGPEALNRAIDNAVEAARAPEKDKFRDARHALRKKLFDHHDGLASQRVSALILKQLDAMKL